MKPNHSECIRALESSLHGIFKNRDRTEAHSDAAPVLVDFAKNKSLLSDVISGVLLNPRVLTDTRNGPVIGLSLFSNWQFSLVLHCFLPLPNRAEGISHNWIHHHDHSLLTTINAFGKNGYEAMLFDKDYVVDDLTEHANLSITKEFRHPLFNADFVPAMTPHLIFIPPELTITLALWSSDRLFRMNTIKNSRAANLIKRPVKLGYEVLGRKESLDKINVTHKRQFAPDGDAFVSVGYRRYAPSTNSNYIQNLFFVMQEIGYSQDDPLQRLREVSKAGGRQDVVTWIDKFLAGDNIPDLYEPAHLDTEGVNFTRESVLAAAGRKV